MNLDVIRFGSMKCIWHCCFQWDWCAIAMASLCALRLGSIVFYTDKSGLNAVPMLTQDKLIFLLEMRVCFPNKLSKKLWTLLTTTTLLTLTPLRRKKTGANTEAEEEDTAIWMLCRECGTCPRNPVGLDLDVYLHKKELWWRFMYARVIYMFLLMLQPCLVSLQELRQLRQPLNCKVRINKP